MSYDFPQLGSLQTPSVKPSVDKFDLYRGAAGIVLVCTLLTIAELVFYKKVVSPQIRKSIDALTVDASIIDSVMNTNEKFSNLNTDDIASKINSLSGATLGDKDSISASVSEATADAAEDKVQSMVEEKKSDADNYSNIVIESEEKIITKANSQTYIIGGFIVIMFALFFAIIYAYMKGKGQPMGGATYTGAIVTVFFLMLFQGYFYELTSNKFGFFSGSIVLCPTESQIKEQVLTYLGGN